MWCILVAIWLGLVLFMEVLILFLGFRILGISLGWREGELYLMMFFVAPGVFSDLAFRIIIMDYGCRECLFQF